MGGQAVVTALAAVLVLSACQKTIAPERPPQAGDVAVARVDGLAVWKSDVVREALAQGLIGEGERMDPQSVVFQRVLDEVIDQKLLASEAVRRNIDRQPAAQRRLAAARERILGDMVVERAVERAVNEDAVRALYREQTRLQKPAEEFRARQIVVATHDEADSLKALIRAGGAFDKLARQRSTDAETRDGGGELGYFTPEVMPAYAAALDKARTGQILGPIQIDGGWALLQLEDRRKQPSMTLEAARPQIVRFLTYAQVGDLLKGLRSQGRVETLIKPAPAARPKGSS